MAISELTRILERGHSDNVSTPSRKGRDQTFKSVAVIGAAGQTGELFTRTLATQLPVEAVVREHRLRDETVYPQVRFHTNIAAMLETDPEAVILATPNSTKGVLEEIAQHAQKPMTLILPQNGVDVVPTAEEVLASSRNQFTIVRASLFTNVSRDEDGNIAYNSNKNRIALAAVGDDQNGSLQKAQNMFAQAGFDVQVMPDYKSMEWTKLVVNLLGSSSTITGFSPIETFRDRQLFVLEHRAFKDRLAVLKAAGIEFADIKWAKKLKILARLPGIVGRIPLVRRVIAGMISKERNNQPSAAARQINEGARKVEPTNFYHQPMVYLAKEHSLRSPVDEAILDILRRHERTNNDFSLTPLDADKRRKLFFEIFGYETKDLFVRSFLPLRVLLERVFEHYIDSFGILGTKNLQAVAESLKKGKSVLLVPNHRSHIDHPAALKALRKSLSKEARRYPVYIVAGMKFDQESISGKYSRAYSHPVLWTLTEEDSEEVRWKAQIINRRADKVIDKLLEKPCIFVVYLEGGRSKVVQEGKVQLQKGAPAGSSWLADPRFELVMPIVIRGTEEMLAYGEQRLHHAGITIEFCKPIEIDKLKEKETEVPRKDRDRYVTEMVLRAIATNLPDDERGSY